MNYRRISAAAAALCFVTAVGVNCAFTENIPTVSAEENTVTADTITLDCVGDKSPIKLGGTTETPTWYSDDETVAVVVPTGKLSAEITAVGKGTASVYAVLSGQTLRFDVVVLRENAEDHVIKEVGTIKLTNAQNSASADLSGVDNSAAEWSSSNEEVAVVDREGNITAVGTGECVITAIYEKFTYIINVVSEYNPQQSTTPVENYIGDMVLSDAEPSQKITADLPDGMTVKYSSTDEKVAVVSADGIVTAKGSGNCRIYAEIGNSKSYIEVKSTYTGQSQGSSVEVGSIDLNDKSPSQKIALNNIPSDADIAWSSSDTSIAVVNPDGVIVAVGGGSCKVTADVAGDKKYIINVNVDGSGEYPVTEIRGIGKTIALQEMSGDVKYYSSDESVASVDGKGTITSVGEGFAVITADSGKAVTYLRVRVVKAGMVGDANCDGKITIADSTAILQHLGNEDKYGLSEEGKINGDVDGVPGITSGDALSIQKFDAKIISSLPEKP